MSNGEVWERGRYYSEHRISGYYVHPLTGVLEYSTWKRNRYRSPVKIQIPVPGNDPWVYEVIDGLWFRTMTIEYKDSLGHYIVVRKLKRSANRKEIVWIKKQLVAA
jgi:hypothetical protein